jgi:hypothetical protein
MMTKITPHTFARAVGFAAALLVASTGYAQQFTTYDLIVPVTSTGTLTTVDGAGRIMPTNRSFVIGLEGGLRGPLKFTNWVGSPEFPVVIVNRHGTGRVVVTDVVPGSTTYTRRDGIAFGDCQYFQLRGDNDPAYRYGIEVAQVGNKAGHTKVGVALGGGVSDAEVMFLEIHDSGFVGIMAKSDPSCGSPQYWAANYVMRNISLHDNYIHDIGGEGMYIGYTSWHQVLNCSGTPVQPHEIEGLRISYNLIERTGWDGAQVASNTADTKVFNNVIFDSGLEQNPFHGTGFQIGSGGTGEYFNNVIINSSANSFFVGGQIGNVSVFNNLMVNGGDYGIFAKNLPEPPPSDPDVRQTIPGTFVSFYNNTIVNPANAAYYTIDEVSVNNFKNNIAIIPNVNFDAVLTGGGASVNEAGNVMQRNYTGLNFVNPAEHDFRITSGSNAQNVGVALDTLLAPHVPVTDDFQGNARPQGTAFDAGFNETGSLSVYLVATPPSTGNTGSLKASTVGGTAPYTYAWSNGATTETISSLVQGLYSVTVTDAVGAKMSQATYLFDGASMGAPVRVTPNNQVITPQFSPAPGTYSGPVTVTIITPTPGDVLRYTTDGSLPTPSRGSTYGGPITVGGTTTLKVIAYKSGMVNSEIAIGTYVIDSGPANTKFTLTNAAITESSHQGSTNTKDKTIDGNLTTKWQSLTPVMYAPSGAWISSTHASAHNGDYHAADIPDAYVEVVLPSTTQISWYGAVGPAGGIAAVSIDGGAETLVDTYAPTLAHNQLLYVSDLLTSGGHIVRVRVTNTKNPSSTGYTIVADRFVNASGVVTNDSQHRQWICYDLGAPSRIAGLKMAFTSGHQATYRFEIETSTDDVTYTPLINGRVPGHPTWFLSNRDLLLQDFDLPDVDGVRYVRLVGHGNDNSNKNLRVNNAYAEVEIWGGAAGSALPRGIYQAETATLSGPTVKTNQTGYTGTGFVAFTNASGDSIEWTVQSPAASTRGLTFRYQLGGSPRTVAISVNGVVVEPALSFHGTGAPGVWVDRAIAATLPAGTVTIRMTTTGSNGPNVDALRID